MSSIKTKIRLSLIFIISSALFSSTASAAILAIRVVIEMNETNPVVVEDASFQSGYMNWSPPASSPKLICQTLDEEDNVVSETEVCSPFWIEIFCDTTCVPEGYEEVDTAVFVIRFPAFGHEKAIRVYRVDLDQQGEETEAVLIGTGLFPQAQ